MAKKRVLLVDDDEGVRFGMRSYFETRGFDVAESGTCADALSAFEAQLPDAVVVDFQLPDGDALDLVPAFKQNAPEVPVILLTGHGTIDRAVAAMQAGADHFLTKPVEMSALSSVLDRVMETRRLQRKEAADQITTERHRQDPFVGRSEGIRRLRLDAQRVSGTDTPVLILGPTGAGKGVLAAWLHAHGLRAQEPFVDINCASLSREFLETELFGHRKGAFTGAASDKPGLLEVADGGTVFLDEIGDMDLTVQPKLLKVVEQGRFRRLGEVQDRSVDVRLIAATHHDLATLVREKKFRDDLYFRINAFPLYVPPLRERREDVPLLASRIAEELAQDTGRARVTITPEAIDAMLQYDWPGNIREMRNVIERALLLSGSDEIGVPDLRFETTAGFAPPHGNGEGDGLELTLDQLERRHVTRVLEATNGKVEEAARRLGIPRSTLYQKLKQYGIALKR